MKKKTDINELLKSVEHFNADINSGLTTEQVNKRIEQGLVNKSKKAVTKTYWEIIRTNAFSLFNIVLYAIAICMAIAKQFSSMVFVLILLCNVAIGIIQDIRARNEVRKLSLVTEPKSYVVRDGKICEIPSDQLVLDDIVILKAGTQICADGVVLDGNIYSNESFLTGESEPIKKEMNSEVFSGSYVVSGTCKCKVTKVGKANYVETLQTEASQFKRPNSEILKSFKTIFQILSIIVIIIGVLEVGALLLKYFVYKEPTSYNEIVASVGASLVAMIPIGMYLLTSLTLTVGVINLAKKKMLVHELYCIEMLARVNILCLDKTGTLTNGEMDFQEAIYFEDSINDLLFGKYMSSLLAATKDENLTAKALINKYGLEKYLISDKAIPFDSERKYSCAHFKNFGSLALGAFGFVKITNQKQIEKQVRDYEKQGLRVLVLASSPENISKENQIENLKAIGLVILKEKIRSDAIENINWFKNNGVEIRIISGDSHLSVSQIGKEVGVEGYEKTVSLEDKNLKEVYELAKTNTVFGRVNPEQKREIIKSLRDDGNVVAMTGDGVNDILALKQADCSIAMASGTDAAKTISHLVSLESNFGRLPDVVREGRRVINNLQRTCSLFLVKTIFAIIVSLSFFIISLIPDGSKYPYVTNNLYIWEIITIGLSAFILALQPNSEKLHGSFISNLLKNSIPAGIGAILCVGVSFTLTVINPTLFSYDGAIACSVLMITCFSFLTLVRVCWPMNKFRSFVFWGAFIISAALLIVDCICYFNGVALGSLLNSNKSDYNSLFFIRYEEIKTTQGLASLLAFLIISTLYLFVAHMLKHKEFKPIRRKNK